MTTWYNFRMEYPLRTLRKSRGLTLQQVADHLTASGIYEGAVPSHVVRLEARGTDRYPVLCALADFFQLPLDQIADLADPKKVHNLSH